MLDGDLNRRWLEIFPQLAGLDPEHLSLVSAIVAFKALCGGGRLPARLGPPAYVMCVEGRTCVFKISEDGREILL